MWKLKIAEGKDPYLYSTNNFIGRKTSEFDPDAGTLEDRESVEKARDEYRKNFKKDHSWGLPCADLLARMQPKKENSHIDLSIPPVKVGEGEKVAYEAATIGVIKAVRLNRAIQARDGHWPSENAGSLFFTPPLLIVLHISGAINTILTPEHKKELKRYINLHQNDDGGWGFYVEGHSTMTGSALSYVALRLLGEGSDDGENGTMTKGRKWIKENGGATGIPSWGKTYLSVLGVYEWAGCNPLPPEFWRWPSFLPFNPAKKWSYCRTTYMPMSYLYARKFHGPITNLVMSIREEIHAKPYEEIDWNKARHACCKDLLWDSLHYLSEPILKRWPFNKIRERAIAKSVRYLRYNAENTRLITIGCVEKSLQMMCWWSENPNGDEFKHHLARVADYMWLAEHGMKMQDTSLATQAIVTTNLVEEYGDSLKKAHFYIKESQIKENPSGDYESMYRYFTKGAWTFSDQDQGWVVSDCTAKSLECLLILSQMPEEIVGEKADTQRLYDAVNVLLYMQGPKSGGFPAWEPAVSSSPSLVAGSYPKNIKSTTI